MPQKEFADLLGISLHTYKSIILGRRNKRGIPPDLARKIAYTLGVQLGTFERRGRKPLDLGLWPDRKSRPYSRESYSAWQSLMEGDASTGTDAYRSKLALYLVERVLLAASERKRFMPAFLSLAGWISETKKDFDLEATLGRMHRDGIIADGLLMETHGRDKNGPKRLVEITLPSGRLAKRLFPDKEGAKRFVATMSPAGLLKWKLADISAAVMVGCQ